MIDAKKLANWKSGMVDEPISWPEVIDTLEAALAVVRAAKVLTLRKTASHNWKGDPVSAFYQVDRKTFSGLLDSLVPFRSAEEKRR